MAAMMIPFVVAGCFGLEHLRVFQVSIVNDTPGEVVLRGCDDYCSSALLTFDLVPGSSAVVNRTTNMHKYFSVTTPAGKHLGCLDLYFSTPQPGASVGVSQAVACPTGSRLPWLPIGLVALTLTGGLLLAWLLARRAR